LLWLGIAGVTWLPAITVLGIVVVVVCLYRPTVPAIALLFLVAGPVDAVSPMREIAGVRLTPGDLALYLAIAGLLLRLRYRRNRPRPRGRWLFTVPLCLYLGAAVVSIVVARAGGDSLGEVRSMLQTMAMLGAYVVFRELWTGRPATLATTLVVVSGVSAALVLVVAALHIAPLTGSQIDYVITDGRLVDTLRLDPPVLRLLSITLLMVTFGKVLKDRPFVRLPIIAVMLALELFSYTRSTWIPLIAVSLVVPPLLGRRWVPVVAIERLVVACVVAAVALVLASAGVLGSTGSNAVDRLSSTVRSDTIHDSSLQDRVGEMEHAWTTIQARPWLGVGLGRPYGAYTTVTDPITDEDTHLPQRFIHNSYVGVWVWMGIPGVLAVLALAGAVVVAACRLVVGEYRDRLPGLAAASGLAVLAASTSFQTNLVYRPALLALAVGLAYVDVALTARRKSATELRPGASTDAWLPTGAAPALGTAR
jgi:hypothetical protein